MQSAHELGEEFGYIATKVELAIDWVFEFSRAIDDAMALAEPLGKLVSWGGRLMGAGEPGGRAAA